MTPVAMALTAFFLGAALLMGGGGAVGRLLLAAGQPEAALHLLDDPQWKGLALYRLGRFEEAALVLRQGGEPAFYNRGNALAMAGRYEQALAIYDAHLFRYPEDGDAAHNRALVATLYAPPVGEARAGGRIETVSAPPSDNDRRYTGRKVYAKQRIVASTQWLTTIADEPGLYLKLRLKAEHERRSNLGIALPPADSPW